MVAIMSIKIKSATLVETIVALVLILALFAIVTTVILQTTKSAYSEEELYARQAIQEYVLNTDSAKAFFNEAIQKGALIIKREVITTERYPGAVVLHFVANNSAEKKIASKEVVLSLK